MKITYTIVCILVTALHLFAQSSATLSGKILDGADQEPLPFATLVLNNAVTQQMVSGALSDETGR